MGAQRVCIRARINAPGAHAVGRAMALIEVTVGITAPTAFDVCGRMFGG